MKRVGTVTTAVGLVLMGGLLLLGGLYPELTWASNPLKWWPLLLIGLGVELIVRRAMTREVELKIDPLIIIFLLGIFLAGIYNMGKTEIINSGIFGWKYNFNKTYEEKVPVVGTKMIEIELPEGDDVRLLPASDGQLTVKTDLALRSNTRKTAPLGFTLIEKHGERLSVRQNINSWPAALSRQHVETWIYIPPGIPVNVQAAGGLKGTDLNNPLSVNGYFRLAELTNLGSSLDVNGFGEVQVRGVKGKVNIRSKGGTVRISDLTSDLVVDAADTVDLVEVYGTIDVDAKAGSIWLKNQRGMVKDCRLSVRDGSIELSTGVIDNCQFRASVTNGTLMLPDYLAKGMVQTIDGVPGERRQVEVNLGKGGQILDLNAINGTITVR